MSSQVLCSATKLLSYAFFSLIQNVETIDSVKKKKQNTWIWKYLTELKRLKVDK